MIGCFICNWRMARTGTPVTPMMKTASGCTARILAACAVASVAAISIFSVARNLMP